MQLSQEQKDLIAGTLLGDGNLQTATMGRTWRYRGLQKKEHIPYLQHKYDVLKPFISMDIAYGEVIDDRTKETYYRHYFNTCVNDSFRYYGNAFYTNLGQDKKTGFFVKNVPKNVDDFLTPRAIAYMYMDDGALKWVGHSNAMRICTESFTEAGCTRIINSIKALHGIELTLAPKKNKKGTIVGYRLYIPEKSSGAFTSLIRPFLVDCMKYKVSDGNYGNLAGHI